MKKFLRITAVVLAVIIVLGAGLSLFINAYFTSGRLKALIVPEIERATGRKVSIGRINISLFREGVVLSDMALARRSGKGDFLSARELVFKYRFLPLLKKQLVIDSLSIDSPYFFIERAKDGTFNFSDLKARFQSGESGKEKEKSKAPFNVAIKEISIENAKVRFVDEMGKLPAAQADASMDFSLSGPGQTPNVPAISGEIDLKGLRTAFKNVNANISGKIKIAGEVKLALEADIGRDRIKINGTALNYTTAPAVDLNISSQKVDLDRLLSLMPPGGKRKGAARGKVPVREGVRGAKRPASNVSAKGRISIATALYKRYVIRGLDADWRYLRGAFSVSPFRASISGGDKVIVQGNLLGSIGYGKLGRQNTLYGKGQARFSRILVKQSPISSQIAALLGMPELGAPSFTGSIMNYEIKNGSIFLDGYLDSAQFEFNPVKGIVGVNKALNVAVDLDLSPALSARIGKKYLRFLTNAKGWTVVPLKITGTTAKPHVGISKASVGKALKKGLGGEIERGLQKLFR